MQDRSLPAQPLLALLALLALGATTTPALGQFYDIRHDPGGLDCARIGTWDAVTRTCTLTGDVAGEIAIWSDDVRLDGAGFTLYGDGDGTGVSIRGRRHVTVRNLTIVGFDDGVELIYGGDNALLNNVLGGNRHAGILLRSSSDNLIAGNRVSDGGMSGIWLWNGSSDNRLNCNETRANRSYGIFIDRDSDANIVRGNRTSGDRIGIRLAWESDDNRIFDNSMSDHEQWGLDLFVGCDTNQVYGNNFLDNNLAKHSPPTQVRLVGGADNVFNLGTPDGGNYWSDWDTPAEGCIDAAPADGFCDRPYRFEGGVDALPRVAAACNGCPEDCKNGLDDDCDGLTDRADTEDCPPLPVMIDVKPGSDENPIHSDGHGAIPVAILGSEAFDVTQVDVATLELDGQPLRRVGKQGRRLVRVRFVDGDAWPDLMLQFQDVAGTYGPDATVATLTGQLLAEFGATPIQGSDAIRPVP